MTLCLKKGGKINIIDPTYNEASGERWDLGNFKS